MTIVKKDGQEVNPLILNGTPMITSQPAEVSNSTTLNAIQHEVTKTGLHKAILKDADKVRIKVADDNQTLNRPTSRSNKLTPFEIIAILVIGALLSLLIMGGIEWWAVQTLFQKGN